jgi:hypothetical protein
MQKALREFLLLYEEDMRYTNKRKWYDNLQMVNKI